MMLLCSIIKPLICYCDGCVYTHILVIAFACIKFHHTHHHHNILNEKCFLPKEKHFSYLFLYNIFINIILIVPKWYSAKYQNGTMVVL